MAILGAVPETFLWRLPYESWDPASPDGELELLSDESGDALGIVWEVTPFCVELAGDATLGQLAHDMAQSVLRTVPAGTCLQMMLMCRPTEGREFARWLGQSAPDAGILETLARRRVRFKHDFYLDTGSSLYFSRDLRVYMALRSAPVDLPRAFKDPAGVAERTFLSDRAAFLSHARNVENAARAVGLRMRRLGAEERFVLIRRLLNPTRGRDGRNPALRAEVPVCEQLLSEPLARDWDSGTISQAGFHMRVLTPHLLPPAVTTGQFTRELVTGALRLAISDLVPIGHVTLSMVKPDQAQLQTGLGAKKLLAIPQRSLSALCGHIADDTQAMTDYLAAGHDAFRTLIHVVIGSQNVGDLDARVQILQSAMEAQGFSVEVEKGAYVDYALRNTLPLGVPPSRWDETQRCVTLHDVGAAMISPVWGGTQGTKTPDHLMLDRRGRPVTFSLWDTPTRVGHTIVVAPTGSGKSVTMKTFMMDVLRKGGYVFVINKHTVRGDRGEQTNDYKRFADVLGELGAFIHFDLNHPPDFNVCSGEFDREANLFLTTLIAEVVTLGDETFRVRPDQFSIISEKIQQAYEFFARRHGGISFGAIRSVMANAGEEIARQAAAGMAMFCGRGVFSGFFDGRRGLDCLIPKGARYVCYELAGIAERSEIVTPLSLTLLEKINRFWETLPVGVPKMLVIEEANNLLKATRTAQFISSRAREARKVRGGLFVVTQHARDFRDFAGRNILGDKANMVLLSVQPDELAETAEILKLDAEEQQAVASLRSEPGKFGELYFRTARFRAILRLVLGSHNYWYLTSDPEDLAAIEEERTALSTKTGREPAWMELIDRLAEKYPFGKMGE